MMEKFDIICCAPVIGGELLLPDNHTADCADCGCRIQFRPHAPEGLKLCISCTLARMADEDHIEITTTRRMIEDFVAWQKKQRH